MAAILFKGYELKSAATKPNRNAPKHEPNVTELNTM